MASPVLCIFYGGGGDALDLAFAVTVTVPVPVALARGSLPLNHPADMHPDLPHLEIVQLVRGILIVRDVFHRRDVRRHSVRILAALQIIAAGAVGKRMVFVHGGFGDSRVG